MDHAEYSPLPLTAPILRRPENCAVPLTAMQLWGWEYYRRAGTLMSGRVCVASARILGSLDADILIKSIRLVAHRHEALRTRILEINGIPHQCIDPSTERVARVLDLSDTTTVDTEVELRTRIQEFVRMEVDLSIGPLFEAGLFKASALEHVLIVMLDHIVSDGWSYGVLMNEIWVAYQNHATPLNVTPTPELQFADYAVWQKRTHSDWRRRHEAYWISHLKGSPPLKIPCRSDAGTRSEEPAKAVSMPLGRDLRARLHSFATRVRAPLALFFLTTYLAVMSRCCHQDDLVVRFVSHGRHSCRDFQRAIGFFASNLHLRVKIGVDDSPIDLLKNVQAELYTALQHHDFDRVPALIPELDARLVFNWQSVRRDLQSLPGLTFLDYQHGANDRKIPFYNLDEPVIFSPAFFDTGDDIDVLFYFRPDFIDTTTLDRFMEQLRSTADRFMTSPGGHVI